MKKIILGMLLVCSLAFSCGDMVEAEGRFSKIVAKDCYVTGMMGDASDMTKIIAKYKKQGYVMIKVTYIKYGDNTKAIMLFGIEEKE